MGCRCPICSDDLGRRKLGHAVVARMKIECSFCKNYLQPNVPRAERITVLVGFAGFLALATVAWMLESQALAIVAFGAAMLGALSSPLLKYTYLRQWPHCRRIATKTTP